MHCVVPVQNGDVLDAVQGLLRSLLQSGAVDALLVPLRHPAGDAIAPALVKDPAMLALADPLAPVLPVNGARLASMLTQRDPHPRIGVVMRNCEIRALIELAKLNQANVEGLIIVGIDCQGTYELSDYGAIAKGADSSGFTLRQACRMCEYPVPIRYDILVQTIGLDSTCELHLEVEENWVEALGLTQGAEAPVRSAAVRALVAEHTVARDAVLEQFAGNITSPQKLADFFSACIRCHNCMTNCPICYCKTCLFKTDIFDHEPMQIMAWAGRKGAIRLPPDSVLFHLTRMNHMSTSCVGCGLCTSACPAGIPVGAAFRASALHTQSLFDYVAGRSLDEAPPVMAFKIDELHSLGEQNHAES